MPGHNVPAPYVWDSSFEVFYQDLDEEHKTLFRGLFECAEQPDSAQELARLTGLMARHFKHEEMYLKRANYSGFDTHKKAHDGFMNRLFGVYNPIPASELQFMMDWLVNHIKDTDFKYKGKL